MSEEYPKCPNCGKPMQPATFKTPKEEKYSIGWVCYPCQIKEMWWNR